MNDTIVIRADQFYFGEIDRGHGLICASTTDKDSLNFLSRVTDMPINKPANVRPVPFYGCHAFNDALIFTKTFTDLQASRPGIVFTHAFVIHTLSIAGLNDLNALFSQFVVSIPQQKPDKLPPITIVDAGSFSILPPDRQDRLLPLLHFYLSAKETDYCVLPLDDNLPELYIDLWNALPPALRYLLTFRLSFHASDTLATDHQLYVTPTELYPQWPESAQHETYKLPIDAKSLAIKLLLREPEADTFGHFIRTLNHPITNFQSIQHCETAFTSYQQLATISTSKLLQLLRLIFRLSPSKTDAKTIKKEVIAAIGERLDEHESDTFTIFSLGNIDWTASAISPAGLGEKVASLLSIWWKRGKIDLLKEVLTRRLSTQQSQWWTTAIDSGFKQELRIIRIDDARITWTLWQTVEESIDYLWPFIRSEKANEQQFMASLPRQLGTDRSKQVVSLLKNQSWLLLHASIIGQYMQPAQALAEQLSLNDTDEPSLAIISALFTPALFIQTAIPYNNQKLLNIALALPVSLPELETFIQVEKPEWQTYIEAKLQQSVQAHKNLDEYKFVVTKLLDSLVNGSLVRGQILSLMGGTTLADLSTYHLRSKVWGKLSGSVRDKFLKATGHSLLSHLTTVATLEPALLQAMLSLNIVGEYMHTHNGNWSEILRIFELFPSLPETYLVDYLTYSNRIDTDVNANRLGRLIIQKKWDRCAKIVFQKAHHTESFKPALDFCLPLLGFWDKIRARLLSPGLSATLYVSEVEWLEQFESVCVENYDEETEIRIIWQKAGGDVADLRSKVSARQIWQHALQQLKKGKATGLTFENLLHEMTADLPTKREQLNMLLASQPNQLVYATRKPIR